MALKGNKGDLQQLQLKNFFFQVWKLKNWKGDVKKFLNFVDNEGLEAGARG